MNKWWKLIESSFQLQQKKNLGYFFYPVLLKMLKCSKQGGKNIFLYILWCFFCLGSVTAALGSILLPHLHPNWARPFWIRVFFKILTYFFSPQRFNYAHSTIKRMDTMAFDWNFCRSREGARCIQLILWVLLHNKAAEPCVSICLPIKCT